MIFKQILSRKILKYVILCIVAIAFIFYLKIFFTKGIYFDETFLKKEIISEEVNYIGKGSHGKIHITVKNESNKSKITYDLPNNIKEEYTIDFYDNDDGLYLINIMDNSGNQLFKGEFIKGSSFLYDEKGEFVFDDIVITAINGVALNPYNEDYKISLTDMANIASQGKDRVRGNGTYLFFALFIFTITVIDIKYPLFFFRLKHFLYVDNPQPSDLYLSIQGATWFIYPIIGIILLIKAI